jgi:hypothetical protein
MAVKGRVLQAVIAIVVIGLLAAVFFALNGGNDRKEDGPKDDGGTGNAQPVFKRMNVTIMDAYLTDKVTSYIVPPITSQVFLVLDLRIGNPLGIEYNLSVDLIAIGFDGGTESPSIMGDYVGHAFSRYEHIMPFSSISGLIYYPIFTDRTVTNISFMDNLHNLTFSKDLVNASDLEMRRWTTPLRFEIVGCGRDPAGSAREDLLYIDLRVTDPSDNASHFQCWLLDLECHDGVVLDGLFVPQPNDPIFMPGWDVTYRVYFDIPVGSPDRPKTLYQAVEGMSLDVDEGMYEGLI